MGRKRGSVRRKPKVKIVWKFRFWWPDDKHDTNKGIPGNRLGKGGYEMMGRNKVTVEALQNDTPLTRADGTAISTKGRGLISIDRLIEDCATLGAGIYTLRLTPPADLTTPIPAGPHMKEPSGKLNTKYRVLMRPLSFDIEIDASGKILGPDRDNRIFMPYSEDDRPDGEPAPHGSVIRKKVEREIHFIVDWKFDWINRHSPKSRPLQKSRVRADGGDQVDTLVLHITSGPRIESALQKFLSPNKFSGIHYIVDLDGHVVKLMEERFATFHAGFDDNRDKDDGGAGEAKLREKGWSLQSFSSKWGIKDRGKSSSVFKQSIGIEHQIGLKTPFPKGMTDGCTRLVEQIVTLFGIDPWNVIGHADVIALKGKNRLPKGGGRWSVEEFTKACPGLDFPWKALQDFKTKDGTRRPLSLGPAHGVAAEPKATIYGGVFQHLAFIDSAPPDDTVKTLQTQAIEALQKDLRRMGFWCPGWKSTPRKQVTNSETFGELNFGVYDNATHGAVRLFQRRCMIPRGDKVAKSGRADLITAQRIRQTVASPGLPPLELPRSTPPKEKR